MRVVRRADNPNGPRAELLGDLLAERLFYSANGAATGSCPSNGYHDSSANWMYETPVVTGQDVGAEQYQAQHG